MLVRGPFRPFLSSIHAVNVQGPACISIWDREIRNPITLSLQLKKGTCDKIGIEVLFHKPSFGVVRKMKS